MQDTLDIIKNHPVDKRIVEKLMKAIPNIELDHIDKLYPDLKIDIKKEQEKLVQNDIIIFQFPLYWYNAPSSLKKWIEDVFQHGFSHGSKGKALHGKKLLLSVTAGAPAEHFKEAKYSLDNLMSGMEYLCKA